MLKKNMGLKNKFDDLDYPKDTKHLNQLQTIFVYLQNHIATASMVSSVRSIPQKCITRYKRDLEKSGKLWEVKKTICKHTGFKAWYITTNPKFAPTKTSISDAVGGEKND